MDTKNAETQNNICGSHNVSFHVQMKLTALRTGVRQGVYLNHCAICAVEESQSVSPNLYEVDTTDYEHLL